jgi:anti-sigma B factor antagonist
MAEEEGSVPPPRTYKLPGGNLEVGHVAPGLAVVSVHGEHDLSSEPGLSEALDEAAAHSSVIIDLSDCSFIDSTVIAALVRVARVVRGKDDRLALVIPPEQRHLSRVAEMTRLGEVLAIYPSRASTVSDMQS